MLEITKALLVSVLFIQVIFAILNYGMIYAFLQRRKIKSARIKAHMHVRYAAMLCLGGAITTPAIMSIVDFPKYGLKFFVKEHIIFNKHWALEELEAAQMEERKAILAKFNSGHSGRCDSIW